LKYLQKVQSNDKDYDEKIKIIKDLINCKKLIDIKEIARLSECTYHECILKIKFLKSKGLIKNCYIDEQNGIINECNMTERQLLTRYAPYIYTKQLQLDEIVKALHQTTDKNYSSMRKKVIRDLYYLDRKNLLNGINIDLVDKKIIYYKDFKETKNDDYISVQCQNCGALNDMPRLGKVKCEYCDTILEDKSINN